MHIVSLFVSKFSWHDSLQEGVGCVYENGGGICTYMVVQLLFVPDIAEYSCKLIITLCNINMNGNSHACPGI